MIDLINNEDLSVWKDYLTYHAINGNSRLLSEEIFNTSFAFMERVKWSARATSTLDD
eukprot:UN18030